MTDVRKLTVRESIESAESLRMAFGPSAVTPQELMLKLIELSRFNRFDGPQIVQDLLRHRDLWDAVLLYSDHPGLTLRDLSDNYYNADTLALRTTTERYEALKAVVTEWMADILTVFDAKGGLRGSRLDSDDGKTFDLQPVECGDNVGHFLLSGYGTREDDRIVLQLWWD